MTDTSLRIIIWNANGLAFRCRELETFLRYNKIDIALISETHFISKNYLKMFGFIMYHTSHPSGKAHAGSAIIVKNNVKHFLQDETRKEYLQTTVITIQDNNAKLNIATAYCPPRHNIKKDQFIEELIKLGPRFIIGGDFNAKHTAKHGNLA